MRRRALILALIATVGLASMAMLLANWRMRPEVSLTTIIDRLTAGQSEAEVSAILGPPTADVTGRLPARFPTPSVGNRVLEFTGERATAGVEFGPDGRLVRAYPIQIQSLSGPERIRSRLNLWW